MQFALKTDKSLYTGKYGWALRAIGQDLAKLSPETFEITTDGEVFIARGRSRPVSRRFKESLRRRFSRFKHADARDNTPNLLTPSQLQFVRTYTLNDIRQLDSAAFSRRSGNLKKPDIYDLPERLRIIGRMIDSKAGRLLKLRKEMNSVTLEYEDASGETQTEEGSALSSYKHQQRYHSKRKTPWDGEHR